MESEKVAAMEKDRVAHALAMENDCQARAADHNSNLTKFWAGRRERERERNRERVFVRACVVCVCL